MPILKRPLKIPAKEEALYPIGDTIRTRRNNIAQSMLTLSETIGQLSTWQNSDETNAFLAECGLSEDEVSVYTAFAKVLGSHGKKLKDRSFGYDAMKALANADDDALRHAIALLEAKGRLGERELADLREVSDDARTSDHAKELQGRERRIQEECLRLASARAQDFTRAARDLYSAMNLYRDQYHALDFHRKTLEDSDSLPLANQDIGNHSNARGAVQSLETLCDLTKQEVTRLAANLLMEFDGIFPVAFRPQEDWAHVGVKDPTSRKFAESRHALTILSTGAFLGDFPSETSTFHYWDSHESIAFLAGFQQAKADSNRHAPRPVKKLNAVLIGIASGAEALGLEAAGFKIRAAYTPLAKRPDTNDTPRDRSIRHLALNDQGFATDMRKWPTDTTAHPIHLLAGALRDEPFKERGQGEHDRRQEFSRVFEILEEAKPEAFFLECASELLNLGHTVFRNKLIMQAREMGFIVGDLIEFDSNRLGVPSRRLRSVFVGVKADYVAPLRAPILANPVVKSVGDVISDVAFPSLNEILQIPAKERSSSQVNYLQWATNWLGTHGKKTYVPDTLGIHRLNSAVRETWRSEFGFQLSSDDVIEPHFKLDGYESLPMTIRILKRLQGIPDNWEFEGDYDDQVEQVCRTIPPVVSRVIGHTIHGTLTGAVVDLDRAARKTIVSVSGHLRIKGGMVVGMHASENPDLLRAREWRNHIEGEENTWWT